MSSNIARDLATSMFANGKWCLAPMVRCGTLPLRLLALKYGASTVWGPEIIDHKLPQCTRVENERLGTVDFLMPNGSLCFRTKRSLEKGKLVFQLGSSSRKTALAAVKTGEKRVTKRPPSMQLQQQLTPLPLDLFHVGSGMVTNAIFSTFFVTL